MSAFYDWLDCVKRLVETVGLNPKGEIRKLLFFLSLPDKFCTSLLVTYTLFFRVSVRLGLNPSIWKGLCFLRYCSIAQLYCG